VRAEVAAKLLAKAGRVVEGGLSFSAALQVIKGGHRAQRAGWNGKGMWVLLVPAAFGRESEILPFLALRTVQGDLIPWTVSQADVLGEDWQIMADGGASGE
jgi:hypothetical protein